MPPFLFKRGGLRLVLGRGRRGSGRGSGGRNIEQLAQFGQDVDFFQSGGGAGVGADEFGQGREQGVVLPGLVGVLVEQDKPMPAQAAEAA